MIKQYQILTGKPVEGRTFDVGVVIDLPSQIADQYLALGIIREHRGESDAPAVVSKPAPEATGTTDAKVDASEAESKKAAPRSRRGRRSE